MQPNEGRRADRGMGQEERKKGLADKADEAATGPKVNGATSANFASEDFDTVGGLVPGCLGRTPEVGDEVTLNGRVIRVDEVDGPRVARVVVSEGDGKQRNGRPDGAWPAE